MIRRELQFAFAWGHIRAIQAAGLQGLSGNAAHSRNFRKGFSVIRSTRSLRR